jgi:hypothetical protein
MNPRFIGIAIGAWLGLAWAIGVGEMVIVLALALAGYLVATLATKRTRGDATDAMTWRWPRRREARNAARRQREARRIAAASPDAEPLRVEVVSGNGSSRKNGAGRVVS